MKQLKINVIFDATILNQGIKQNSGRSGLFFTAFNIFKCFKEDERVKLFLYRECWSKKDLELFLHREFPCKRFRYIDNLLIFKISFLFVKISQKLLNSKSCKKNFLINFFGKLFFSISKFFDRIKKQKLKKFIFFSPVYAIPPDYRKNDYIKRFTILYDTIPEIYTDLIEKSDPNSWWNNLTNSFSVSDYYFSISENTKKDFLRFFDTIDSNKIFVTPIASGNKYEMIGYNEKLLLKYKIPLNKRYVLSVCNLDPRKNLIQIINSFLKFVNIYKITDLVLVLCGDGEKIGIIIDDLINKYNAENLIIKTGYVDDNDMSCLYSNAEWFVFLSKYEGFGMPLLEAMSCGCPVISSDNSSMPEVVGDCGIYVNCDDCEQHIEAFKTLYFNKKIRNSLSMKGLNRAKLFTWNKTYKEIFDKIASICKRNSYFFKS